MSSLVSSRGNDYSDLNIDDLVDKLTPGEIQQFLEECDPDDSQIPPSLRCNYRCDKEATGPLNKKALLDFVTEQALNTPDIPDVVPHVPGTLRGKRWCAPSKPKHTDDIEIAVDLGEDVELALSSATDADIVELSGIMGIHSWMNQDQYHASQSDKAPRADPDIGWKGTTKATPLKVYPEEAPNQTDPQDIVGKLERNDPTTTTVNLNNLGLSEELWCRLVTVLQTNTYLKELSLANTGMSDTTAMTLATALETNNTIAKLNVESNNILPQTMAKIFESINVLQTVVDIKGSNQQAQFLGNKVESAITRAIENNKAILKVGLHFQFGDCRNRVAVQLQKNLDRQRLKRLAQKQSTNGAE